MEKSPNIYPTIVFDLHPKIKALIDALDQAGQIDRDETNTPHIVGVEPAGSVHRCLFMRNGRLENFVMHTRKKADPVRSWREDDGFARLERPPAVIDVTMKKERDRRQLHPFESIVEQILPKRR